MPRRFTLDVGKRGSDRAAARLIADDHERIGLHALRLQPFWAPAGVVRLVDRLRDDAFEVVLAGDAEQVCAGAGIPR